MDIPMPLDTTDTTLARGLLMLSPRLMLMLLFSMVPMDMVDMAWVMLDMDWAMLDMDIPMDILVTTDTTLARGLLMLSLRPRLTPHSCTLPMDMVFPMLDMLDMLDMAILTLMDMPDTHMPG